MTLTIALPPWLPWAGFLASAVVNFVGYFLLRRAWRADREWSR